MQRAQRLGPVAELAQVIGVCEGRFHRLLLLRVDGAGLGVLALGPISADHGQHDQRDDRPDQPCCRRLAAGPAPRAATPPERASLYRAAFDESSQVFRERCGASIAALRLLAQALKADRLRIAGHLCV